MFNCPFPQKGSKYLAGGDLSCSPLCNILHPLIPLLFGVKNIACKIMTPLKIKGRGAKYCGSHYLALHRGGGLSMLAEWRSVAGFLYFLSYAALPTLISLSKGLKGRLARETLHNHLTNFHINKGSAHAWRVT